MFFVYVLMATTLSIITNYMFQILKDKKEKIFEMQLQYLIDFLFFLVDITF